ncbi:STAS domain-containing protein [Priestia megaterium]|uniref:STAS domain-containing protein n=1 Tax=Priestia megaterium TaxID=1404 RepID=UPI00234F7872|nr:STAS domain-containing protein [Priestia megaterium]MDC7779579.1 STAS domain-containing protein [Priestia megaterium]
MKDEIGFLGDKILEYRFKIANEVHESRISGITEEEKKKLAPFEVELINIRAHFISLFGEVLRDHLDEETALQKFTQWGKETGEMFFNLKVSLDEALKDTKYYRTFLWETLKEVIKKDKMSIDTVFEVGGIIDPLLDHAAYSFSLSYVHFYQLTLERAQSTFLELSVPVVPLAKEIAVLPLIGNIDMERANYLMEETLKSANRLQLQRLIVDLSGVYIIDTMVADQIFKVIDSLRFLGVETILTGIRPEVAQTIVSIGIDFSSLTIKSSLQKAIEDLLIRAKNNK